MTKLILHPTSLPKTNDTVKLRTQPRLIDLTKQALMNGFYAVAVPYENAVDNKHAIEGSVWGDRMRVAMKLQEFGKKNGIDQLAQANLAQLDKSINAALRSMEDEEGNPLDRNSRKRAAIELAKSQLLGSESE